MHGTAVKITTI